MGAGADGGFSERTAELRADDELSLPMSRQALARAHTFDGKRAADDGGRGVAALRTRR